MKKFQPNLLPADIFLFHSIYIFQYIIKIKEEEKPMDALIYFLIKLSKYFRDIGFTRYTGLVLTHLEYRN